MSFIAPFAASYGNLTLAYVGNSTSGNTFSFTFPAADANRWLVAVVGYSSGSSQTVTIGGLSAPIIGSTANDGGVQVGIYAAKVPTNSDQTVVLSSGTAGVCSLYSLTGVSVLHTQEYTFASAVTGSTSTTFNVPAGAAILAGAFDFTSVAAIAFTWTNLTQDVGVGKTASLYFSSANANFLAASPSLTVSVSASNATGGAVKIVMFTPT